MTAPSRTLSYTRHVPWRRKVCARHLTSEKHRHRLHEHVEKVPVGRKDVVIGCVADGTIADSGVDEVVYRIVVFVVWFETGHRNTSGSGDMHAYTHTHKQASKQTHVKGRSRDTALVTTKARKQCHFSAMTGHRHEPDHALAVRVICVLGLDFLVVLEQRLWTQNTHGSARSADQ